MKALHPPCMHIDPFICCAGTAADGDLPSVMTCANYIKLPPYSSFQARSAYPTSHIV